MASTQRIDWNKDRRRTEGLAVDRDIRPAIIDARRDSKAMRQTPTAEEMFADVMAILHPAK